jgi:hypothetical protein
MAQGSVIVEALLTRVVGPRRPLPRGEGWPEIPSSVTLREGRLVPALGGLLARLGGPAAAVALRRTIVTYPGVTLSPELLRHELAHVRQWQEDRWFPLRYALETLRAGYRDNRYEREARGAERSHTIPPGERFP